MCCVLCAGYCVSEVAMDEVGGRQIKNWKIGGSVLWDQRRVGILPVGYHVLVVTPRLNDSRSKETRTQGYTAYF